MECKICPKCKEPKPIVDFGLGARRYYCKSCISILSRKYRDKKREKLGLVFRDNKTEIYGSRKYVCDFTFFDVIDTEAKAYWLGFIAADGCVRNNKTFSIGLSAVDKNHLLRLKADLKATYNIYEYTAFAESKELSPNRKKHAVVNLTISSSRMVKALEDKGISRHKTNSLVFPNEDQVPNYLIHHFVRGYFDGDGSIYGSPPSKTGARIWSICIIAPSIFCDKLSSLLCLNTLSISPRRRRPNPKVQVETLTISRRTDILAMRSFLYQDSTIFLDRKKNIFDQVMPVNAARRKGI